MNGRKIAGVEHLPYELTAEHFAQEALARMHATYGENPHVITSALDRELPVIIHDAIQYGLALGGHYGDITPVELLVAYAKGAQRLNEGEQ